MFALSSFLVLATESWDMSSKFTTVYGFIGKIEQNRKHFSGYLITESMHRGIFQMDIL